MEGKEGANAIISADSGGKTDFWKEEAKFFFGYSEEPQWVRFCRLGRAPPYPGEIEEMSHG